MDIAVAEDGGTIDISNLPLATALNRAMVNNFNNETWSTAYVTTDLLPSFTDFAEAAAAAFGSKIAGIKPTEPRFNIFN